ncbi:MAG: YeeE/YedE family protein [Saprospiraceae bacterium]|nr:YeeE/YedE family protein [Saprospiraceae bacterium]
MIEFISQPWHWSVSGIMILVVVFLLKILGERFGISTSFQTMCSVGGGGKLAQYFNYDWKKQSWLLWMVLGTIIGGYIATQFLASPEPVQISQSTIEDLSALGVSAPSGSLIPEEVFNFDQLMTGRGLIIMILGGFLIGFGTRWANGCTSGHAISGLANLQLTSLIAVVGFFIGGLLMTHLLFPLIF